MPWHQSSKDCQRIYFNVQALRCTNWSGGYIRLRQSVKNLNSAPCASKFITYTVYKVSNGPSILNMATCWPQRSSSMGWLYVFVTGLEWTLFIFNHTSHRVNVQRQSVVLLSAMHLMAPVIVGGVHHSLKHDAASRWHLKQRLPRHNFAASEYLPIGSLHSPLSSAGLVL